MRRDLLFLIAAVLLVFVYTRAAGFPLDDSWIHQVYGRNLAQNGEWAFVPGEPTAASTSPLYTVLLSIGYRLNIDYVLWTHTLGALALTAAGMVAARLADLVLPKRKNAGWVTGLAVILSWHLIWAAASGMETILFGALTLTLVWLVWRQALTLNPSPAGEGQSKTTITVDSPSPSGAEGRRGWGMRAFYGLLFGIAAALATLARPEGLLMAGLAGLALLVIFPRGFIAWTVGAALGFAVTITPYLLLNLQLTGGLLPNTAAAKQVQHEVLLPIPYGQRFVSMLLPVLAGGQFLLLVGVVMYIAQITRTRTRREWLLYLLPLVWVVSLIALYAARLPASYQHGRYVIPALPALVTVGVIGTFMLAQQARRSMIGRVLTQTLVISAAMLHVYFGVIAGPGIYREDVSIINEEMVASAHWIRDNLPPEELLAIHDIGAVGYFAPRPMLDVAGLLTPQVIPLINQPEQMWDYLQERGAVYLMAFPDQIPGDDPDDPRLCQIFLTNGQTSQSIDGPNMAVYRLTWDGSCER